MRLAAAPLPGGLWEHGSAGGGCAALRPGSAAARVGNVGKLPQGNRAPAAVPDTVALAAARSGSADSCAKVVWSLGGLQAASVEGLAAAASGAGDIPMLRWLQQQGVRVGRGAVLSAALRQGDLETVRWLVAEGGVRLTFTHDPLGLCNAAAGSCREALCKLDYLVAAHGLQPNDWESVVAAAAAGQVETVRQLHERWGVPLSAQAWVEAAGSGSLATAAYLKGKGCPVSFGDAREGAAYLRAATRGDLAMVRWLAGEGACSRGRARLVEVILSWGNNDMKQVSRSNSSYGAGAARDAPRPVCSSDTELLAAVQLLAAQGWPLGDTVLEPGVGWVGELWAWTDGCVLTALAAAVCRGELPLVRWLRQQGCGHGLGLWGWKALIHVAAATGGEALLEWLWERCPRADFVLAMVVAAKAGNREAFVWLERKWVKTGCCDDGWRDRVRSAMRAGGVPAHMVSSCLGLVEAEVREQQVQQLGRLQRMGRGALERCWAALGIGGAGAAFVPRRLWQRLQAP